MLAIAVAMVTVMVIVIVELVGKVDAVLALQLAPHRALAHRTNPL